MEDIRIKLIWATVRPDFMRETYKYWIDNAKNKDLIDLKIAVNTEEQRNKLSEFDDVIITNQKHIGTVYPAYLLTQSLIANDNDIVILASDDFYPPKFWDEFLISKLRGKTGCYFVNDGYQTPTLTEIKASITIPIMTYDCLCKLNKTLYSLEYYHYYGDTELYYNLINLDLLIDERIDNPDIIFEHKNCVTGKRHSDEFDAKYNAFMYVDRFTFNSRIKLPVEDRIKQRGDVWN